MTPSSATQGKLGQAVVGFSRDGLFPEVEEISAAAISRSELQVASGVLKYASTELEKDIKDISRQCAFAVDVWLKNATALQADIHLSKSLASDIIRQATVGETIQQVVLDGEAHASFLEKEVAHNQQLKLALERIARLKELLDHAENERLNRQILPALESLSNVWDIVHGIPACNTTRAVRLLNDKAIALREHLEIDFVSMWEQLLEIDRKAGSITIRDTLGAGIMNMKDAIAIVQALGKIDKLALELKDNIFDVIVRPRIDLERSAMCSIVIDADTLSISTVPANCTIKSLFTDMEQTIQFLHERLPGDFGVALSLVLIPDLCSYIISTWLDSAVPTSLNDTFAFRNIMDTVQLFIDSIGSLGWAGTAELQEWIVNIPRTWLTKRRETCLDWTRDQLASGIGSTRRVDRVETRVVTKPEEKQLGTNGNDWDAAWSDDDHDTDGRVSPKIQLGASSSPSNMALADTNIVPELKESDNEEVDAWGWDDEGNSDDEAYKNAKPTSDSQSKTHSSHQKTITLTEEYTISSMPDRILSAVTDAIEDGIVLAGEEGGPSPVTAAAVGLFAIPTLVLAMYRAVGPHYYARTIGGNMFLYNDAMWLADQLRKCADEWKSRGDLHQRSRGKVKLDSDIIAVDQFGKRAYASEMSIQRTIITDLLGGAHNFLQHEGQSSADDTTMDAVISMIRTLSANWKPILTKSAWAQATGSLLSSVAEKIIFDVQDLVSLGADEAYRIAKMIAKFTTLDDLFLPETKEQSQVPVTSQYAPNWLKLHFLSEVLQSNLRDVKFLWFESDLSLYFRAQEVIDLIELSFENSHRSREVISAIRENPKPRGEDGGY